MIIGGLPFVILSCGFFFAARGAVRRREHVRHEHRRRVQQPRPVLGGGAITRRDHRLPDEEVHLHAARAVRRLRDRHARASTSTRRGRCSSIADGAPFVAYAIYEWTQKREIDEHKLIPLFLGGRVRRASCWSASSTGARPAAATSASTEGDYAFQHAEVNLLWQAIGLAVCLGAGLVTGAVLVAVLKRDDGPRRSTRRSRWPASTPRYWEIVHDLDPAPAAHGRRRRAGGRAVRRPGQRRRRADGAGADRRLNPGRHPARSGRCPDLGRVCVDNVRGD